MLIPSLVNTGLSVKPSLSRRVNANSQLDVTAARDHFKLIKKGEC